eukprot:320019_1
MSLLSLVSLLYICSISNTLGIIKTCNVTDYGAKGDNKTDNTASIQKAIKECAAASANSNNGDYSLVVLPRLNKGKETVYMSGALWLESNLAFYIEKNVRLLGVPLDSKTVNESYPFIYTRWQGIMNMTHASLLNGGICKNISYNNNKIGDQCKHNWKTLKNVKIYGYGIVDGNGHSGWYNDPYKSTRPCLLNLMWIDGLTIFNITATNSPFWTVHPLFSANILIENITVNTDGPNTDGIDPDSCSNVWITKSYVNTGDDCIAIKSGKDADGRAVGIPSNNITIIDMVFGTGHGISIGSEMSGNVTNVLFANFAMDKTKTGPRIKSQKGRGGMVSNIVYQNITMKDVSTGISVSEYYNSGATGVPPIFKDIVMINVSGSVTGTAGLFECLQEKPCYNITLDNVDFTGYDKPFQCEYAYGHSEGSCSPKSCLNTSYINIQ